MNSEGSKEISLVLNVPVWRRVLEAREGGWWKQYLEKKDNSSVGAVAYLSSKVISTCNLESNNVAIIPLIEMTQLLWLKRELS
jgi:hypothetical protein